MKLILVLMFFVIISLKCRQTHNEYSLKEEIYKDSIEFEDVFYQINNINYKYDSIESIGFFSHVKYLSQNNVVSEFQDHCIDSYIRDMEFNFFQYYDEDVFLVEIDFYDNTYKFASFSSDRRLSFDPNSCSGHGSYGGALRDFRINQTTNEITGFPQYVGPGNLPAEDRYDWSIAPIVSYAAGFYKGVFKENGMIFVVRSNLKYFEDGNIEVRERIFIAPEKLKNISFKGVFGPNFIRENRNEYHYF